MTASETACKACGASDQTRLQAREMMLGQRSVFDYLECKACGSVQIAAIPDDLASFYPPNYHSFAHQDKKDHAADIVLKRFILHPLLNWPALAKRVAALFPGSAFASAAQWGLRPDARILDVGSGAGNMVHSLARLGFSKPLGIDPHIASDIAYSSGASVVKANLEDMAGERFEAVMFHHSLEHVLDPGQALKKAASLLTPGGRCIVRIPTTSSVAFERYRENWIQLDPPRHIFVPSRAAMKQLGEAAGFHLERMIDDSEAFQFWGSELYLKDIPLLSESDPSRHFSETQIAAWSAEAKTLNAQHRGDQSAFVFVKRSP